jgi:hypothetical protein
MPQHRPRMTSSTGRQKRLRRRSRRPTAKPVPRLNTRHPTLKYWLGVSYTGRPRVPAPVPARPAGAEPNVLDHNPFISPGGWYVNPTLRENLDRTLSTAGGAEAAALRRVCLCPQDGRRDSPLGLFSVALCSRSSLPRGNYAVMR